MKSRFGEFPRCPPAVKIACSVSCTSSSVCVCVELTGTHNNNNSCCCCWNAISIVSSAFMRAVTLLWTATTTTTFARNNNNSSRCKQSYICFLSISVFVHVCVYGWVCNHARVRVREYVCLLYSRWLPSWCGNERARASLSTTTRWPLILSSFLPFHLRSHALRAHTKAPPTRGYRFRVALFVKVSSHDEQRHLVTRKVWL